MTIANRSLSRLRIEMIQEKGRVFSLGRPFRTDLLQSVAGNSANSFLTLAGSIR